MRKSISIMVLLLIVSPLLYAQNKVTDLANLNIKGKVKTLTDSTYYGWKKGKIENGKKAIIALISFNEAGYLVEENTYTTYAGLDKKITYKYDTTENKREAWHNLPTGVLEKKVTYKYDKSGNLIQVNTHSPEGNLLSTEFYAYNDKGILLEKHTNDNKEKKDYKFMAMFGKDGKVIEQTCFDIIEGITVKEYTNVFDSTGNLITKSTLFEIFTYKYDQNGGQIEEQKYLPDPTNLTSIDLLQGKKIPWKLFSSKSYSYEYDAGLNWIKRTEFDEKGKAVNIVSRTIIYY